MIEVELDVSGKPQAARKRLPDRADARPARRARPVFSIIRRERQIGFDAGGGRRRRARREARAVAEQPFEAVGENRRTVRRMRWPLAREPASVTSSTLPPTAVATTGNEAAMYSIDRVGEAFGVRAQHPTCARAPLPGSARLPNGGRGVYRTRSRCATCASRRRASPRTVVVVHNGIELEQFYSRAAGAAARAVPGLSEGEDGKSLRPAIVIAANLYAVEGTSI